VPLSPGTRLGPYEIVAPLGAGGMGEVWRARDTRLGRDVAIKVLPDATTRDPEALARFRREAQVVASLAHPNLLALFDVGVEGDVAFAVTELLEGETLRERLARGPLPLAEGLEVARQILRGLAAAHERGVIHRDLKPANLFLTRDGHVKILDFGLAKRVSAGGDEDSIASTVTNVTSPGTVLGTAGYLAPEQLTGGTADARADVFGFGTVLYEMLTGRRAFPGTHWAEVSAAILAREPASFAASGVTIPPALEAVVQRCLAKDPAGRYASAGEVLQALAAAESAPDRRTALRGATPRGRAHAWWIATAAVVAIALALFASRWNGRPRPLTAPPLARPHAIAMLAFENLTGDPSLDWIGRGLPELLGTALARSSELDVYDPQRLTNLLTGAGNPRDSAASIFERLRTRGVGRAIVGSLLRSGRDLRVECRVIDVESGRVLHAATSESPASGDLFALAGGLIPQLQTWLEIDLAVAGTADRWLREITTSSADAYRLYLRGHDALLASRWREAASFAEQSLALDSTFVAARVDLTGALWNLDDEAATAASLAAADRLRPRATPREVLLIDEMRAIVTRDPDGLIRTASALHEIYPENRFFLYLEGRGYFTAGRWQKCIDVLAPLVKEHWTWGWTYVLTSRSEENLGRIDAAKDAYAVGLDVTHRNPELLYEDGKLLDRHGESRAARPLFLEASRSPGLEETPGYEALIRIELAKGDVASGARDSAASEFRRVLTLVPVDSDEAKEARAGLAALGAAR